MKKYLALSFLALTAAQALAAELAQPLKVGFIIPLSGDNAFIGESCRNGIALAQEKLSSTSGTADSPIEVIYEDDRLDARTAVVAFSKLISQEKINAVVNMSSHTGQALGPLADRNRVPLVALASDKGVVDGRTHVVSLWVTPEAQVKVLHKELARRGMKRIARISAIHNATEAFRREFDRQSSEHGDVKVVLEEDYPTDARDFKPFLLKAKAAGELDGIFVNLFFGQIGAFARQASELGIKVPMFGIEVFEDEQEIKASGGALVGAWYIQADDGTDSFRKTYRERFPGKSIYTAANCYDALLLLAEAHSKTEDIIAHLKSLKNYSGALGEYSASGDNRFTLPAIVKVVTESGFERL